MAVLSISNELLWNSSDAWDAQIAEIAGEFDLGWVICYCFVFYSAESLFCGIYVEEYEYNEWVVMCKDLCVPWWGQWEVWYMFGNSVQFILNSSSSDLIHRRSNKQIQSPWLFILCLYVTR